MGYSDDGEHMSNRCEGEHVGLKTEVRYTYVATYSYNPAAGTITYKLTLFCDGSPPTSHDLVVFYDPATEAQEHALVRSINGLIDSIDVERG
jgi:hypothetical protein